MHRITDNRLSSTFPMIGGLCDEKNIESTMLVTTMWDRVDLQTGERREAELLNQYWLEMMELGATSERFDNTEGAAWRIVESIAAKSNKLVFRPKAVDLKKQMMHDNYRLLVEKQRQIVQQLEQDTIKYPELAAEMREEQARIEELYTLR